MKTYKLFQLHKPFYSLPASLSQGSAMKALLSSSSSESLSSSDSLFRPYRPFGPDKISQCTCEANSFCIACAKQDQIQEKSTDPNTAANRFFRDRDLCTLLSQILMEYPTRTTMCLGDTNISSLLASRGVTREAWQGVERLVKLK
jgi:hypothetical protein